MATPTAPSEITLSWQDNSNNEGVFQIQRCAADWGPEQGCPPDKFSTIRTVAANTTTYSDQGLTAADTYGYRVYADSATKQSEYSNVATATASVSGSPPAAPTDLEVGVPYSTLWFCNEYACYYKWHYDLWWQDNSYDEDGFLIESCIGAGCTAFLRLATASANATGYSFEGPFPHCGLVWTWRMRAHNAGGYSGYSNPAVLTTIPCPVKSR